MPIVASAYRIATQDGFDDPRRFDFTPADRIDVTPSLGDVVMQVRTPAGNWDPPAGITLRAGLFRSFPGNRLAYPPDGVTGVRFRRATAGVPATVDFEAWSIP